MNTSESENRSATDTDSVSYYENRNNAEAFIRQTAAADMSDVLGRFLSRLAPGAFILELGCGSGRDALQMKSAGFRIRATDGSKEMAFQAQKRLGLPVEVLRFDDLQETDQFDGIYACACLLHVPYEDLPDIFRRIKKALKPGGIFYCSFKYGNSEREKDGRFFCDLDEERMKKILAFCPSLSIAEQWISGDVRAGRKEEKWLNTILIRQPD